jgi:hypothetical protein
VLVISNVRVPLQGDYCERVLQSERIQDKRKLAVTVKENEIL